MEVGEALLGGSGEVEGAFGESVGVEGGAVAEGVEVGDATVDFLGERGAGGGQDGEMGAGVRAIWA